MSTRQLLNRAVANILFFLKRKEFNAAKLKFLVFTGTAGKTTLRDAVTHALRTSGVPVQSNQLGYSNELGILLTVFGCSEFSLKNPFAWFSLLKKEMPKDEFVCIELGADFYQDIKWFLKKFTPYAVFVGGVARDSWSRDVKDVSEERKCLLEAVPLSGFVFYNVDDPATVELIQESGMAAQAVGISLCAGQNAEVVLSEWSKNVFTRPSVEVFDNNEKIVFSLGGEKVELLLQRSIFEPQIYSVLATFAFVQKLFPNRVTELKKKFEDYQFSKDRLRIFKARNGALIVEDSYKATPLCTFWFLDMSARIPARKRILVITEMRPLTFTVDYFYSKLAHKIGFAERIYFLGPSRYFNILHEHHSQVRHLEKKSYDRVAEEILKNSSHGDLILLKGSFRYELNNLRDLLI